MPAAERPWQRLCAQPPGFCARIFKVHAERASVECGGRAAFGNEPFTMSPESITQERLMRGVVMRFPAPGALP
jgi:hypothetical protein